MKYIEYGKEELDYLIKKDKVLGDYIKKTGFIKRELNSDIFTSLISSIISQQVSTKAAKTINERLNNIVINLTPKKILELDDSLLQSIGISFRKVSYMKDIAKNFTEKPHIYNNLNNLPDHLIVEELIKLKGVGTWTAEMLLIHSFNRRDVISFLDLGIKRGIMRLYNKDSTSKEDWIYFKNLYAPYNTIASIYLWEASK
jgi:DNA-3-methyladenine glycosylase II